MWCSAVVHFCVHHCISIKYELVAHKLPCTPWLCSEEMSVCSFLKCPVLVPLLWFVLVYLYIEGAVCRHWPSSIQQVYANSEAGVKVLVLPVPFDALIPPHTVH